MFRSWPSLQEAGHQKQLQQNEKYQRYQHPYSSSNAAVLQEIGMEGILKLSVLQPIWESLRCLGCGRESWIWATLVVSVEIFEDCPLVRALGA